MAEPRKRRHFALDSLQVLSGQGAMMALGFVNGIITAHVVELQWEKKTDGSARCAR